MARLAREQCDALAASILSHDFLHRILRQIEVLQRTVFHSYQRADWSKARRSAEQMLIAELALRYGGDIDRVYFRLRELESGGKDWAAAIHDVAAAIHSYYTTPLGMVMRRELFGEDVVFLAEDDAAGWMQQAPDATAGPTGEEREEAEQAAPARSAAPKRKSSAPKAAAGRPAPRRKK